MERMLDGLPESLSATTKRHTYTVLRIALGRAVKQQLVVRNVASLIDAPQKSRWTMTPLDAAQIQVFLRAIVGDRLEALYTVAIATAAGFFIAGLDPRGAQSPFSPGTLVGTWGIPVYVDPNLAADDLWVADWKAFKVYIGDQYRVDTSSEAGDRWDKNLTGFRAEMDLAFNARPGVYAGALQVVADILS